VLMGPGRTSRPRESRSRRKCSIVSDKRRLTQGIETDLGGYELGLPLRKRLEGLEEKLFLQPIRGSAGTQVPILVVSRVERVGAGRRSLERH
jgi:hypothetical protein